jgi:hypothetical protein
MLRPTATVACVKTSQSPGLADVGQELRLIRARARSASSSAATAASPEAPARGCTLGDTCRPRSNTRRGRPASHSAGGTPRRSRTRRASSRDGTCPHPDANKLMGSHRFRLASSRRWLLGGSVQSDAARIFAPTPRRWGGAAKAKRRAKLRARAEPSARYHLRVYALDELADEAATQVLRLTTGSRPGNIRSAFLTQRRLVDDTPEAGVDRRPANAY